MSASTSRSRPDSVGNGVVDAPVVKKDRSRRATCAEYTPCPDSTATSVRPISSSPAPFRRWPSAPACTAA